MRVVPKPSRKSALDKLALHAAGLGILCALGGGTAAGSDADPFRARVLAVEELVEAGEYPRALQLADSLLGAAESRTPADSLEIVLALDARVSAQLFLGGEDVADAVDAARRAVALHERLDGDPSTPLSRSLLRLGTLLHQRERHDDADAALSHALHAARRADPPDSLQIAACFSELASLSTDAGDFNRALEYFGKDLAISESILAPDDYELVRKYANLSRLHLRLSDYGKALEYNRRSREICEAIDPDHAALAYLFTSLGSIEGELGHARRSYEAYQRAIELTRRKFGEESVLMLSLLNNMGVYYLEILDYDRARQELEKALALARQLGPEESSYVSTPMANLATVYRDQGDLDEAESLYRRSIELLTEVVGAEHPIVARRFYDLGQVHLLDGEPQLAESDFQRSWEIRIAALPAGNFESGQSLTGRARARQLQGQLDAALADYREGCRIIEAHLGPQHPFLIQPSLDFATLLVELGRPEEAAARALHAESISRNYLILTAGFLSEREALEFSGGRIRGTDLLFGLARSGVGVATAFDQLVRSRAMILDEMAARRGVLVGDGDPDAVAARRTLAARTHEYAGLLTSGAPDGETAEYQDAVAAARTAFEDAQRELAVVSARYRRDLDRRSAGSAELLAALPTGSALVSYVRYRDLTSGDTSSTPELYAAFVVTEDTLQFVPMGNAPVIDELVTDWHRQASRPPRSAQGLDDYRQAARKLRRQAWDPVESLVANADRVLVVPAAELHLVNWSVLVSDDDRFLLESAPPIHYLSAERDLLRTDADGAGLLALGGVDYDERLGSDAGPQSPSDVALRATPRPGLDGLRFSPLPGTAREIDALQELWNGQALGPATLLAGGEATESAFREASAGKRVLHLATHAFVLGSQTTAASGTRGIGGIAALGPETASGATDAASLGLAGLALAGANRRSPSARGDEDGILTAREIAAQDLGTVQWAVLSACDTGRGEIRAGEGVLGLRRAFQVAGARTLIMSLWPVEDESAEAWMGALYRARFEQGQSTDSAVRQASLEVLEARRESGASEHPFYWGGFVAAGSWK